MQFVAEPWYRPPTEELRYLPECPRLLRNFPGDGAVLGWVAIQHGPGRRDGSLNLLDLQTLRNRSIALPGRPGFFVETTRPGTWLVGMEREFVLVDTANGEMSRPGITLPTDQPVIINDGISIPNGLVFGTKHELVRDPVAALYHFDCETRTVRELVGHQTCSNGKYFRNAGGGLDLIDIDTVPKAITWYRFTFGFRTDRAAPTAPSPPGLGETRSDCASRPRTSAKARTRPWFAAQPPTRASGGTTCRPRITVARKFRAMARHKP